MFKEVASQFDFPAMERDILAFWEENKVYEKSLEKSRGGKPFIFFEGPPTANGMPHPGHCLTRAIKDLFPRYKTMTGHYCLRKAGWDTHGLPVEVEVCKELGIHTKEEIEAYGVEAFNRKCLESVFRYTKEWEDMTRRLGFWINLGEAYVTYHQSYVESVWWALKTLFDSGLLYQGYKIVWWWAQGGTALSAGEVGQGYREVDDLSVFVRFPLIQDERYSALFGRSEPPASAGAAQRGMNAAAPISLLVWTTTPWTLLSNMFAAVHNDFDYALVHDEVDGERLILASALFDVVAAKLKAGNRWKIERAFKGADLVGLRYTPPFDCYAKRPAKDFVPGAEAVSLANYKADLLDGSREHVLWRVLHGKFVTLDAGSGLVHEAPAFGEVDFDLFQEDRKRFKNPDAVPLLCAVAPNGTFNSDIPKYAGRWVKDCDKEICHELRERKALVFTELYRHDYPFCWRADEDPLIQYPRKSWFIRTTQFKDDMLENNQQINWLPEHIKAGRFGKFLESNVDWALSRERYWGTPLPIWVCQNPACGYKEAIDSYATLTAKPGVQGLEAWENAKKADPTLSDHLKVHKPYIDAVTYACPECAAKQSRDREGAVPAKMGRPTDLRSDPSLTVGALIGSRGSEGRMRRVSDVIDCWFDSGAMPFAQWGYPHQNADIFGSQFPADFISEALDQTRGWFYSLTAISVMLFGKNGLACNTGVTHDTGSMGLRPVPPLAGISRTPVTEGLTRRRRILPHWEAGGSAYLVTFRLYQGQLSEDERDIVLDACRHWDSVRMLLHAVVVMPDHVHMLCTPLEKAPGQWWPLADLMHSIKGFTAQAINKKRSATGPLWQQEYFDRIIRSASDFDEKRGFVVTNPARRGLQDDYRWIWVEREEPREQTHGPEAHATRAATPGQLPQLAYPMPFKTCIVLGLLMGEDGLKMSKSKKNYRDPDYVFEHQGADAMRWLFFSGQAPWTSIRFQESTITEGQREFLIRLYNCYSFFVIYANIDKWTPGHIRSEQSRDRKGAVPAGILAAAPQTELDRWIISELNQCCVSVFKHMEAYDNYNACKALIQFLDALSNWYVRRNRERFWRSGMDADKNAAYATLHQCLVTLSKLLAPFTPFFAESMYQNLVRTHDPDAPASVHLCSYPITEANKDEIEKRIDRGLNSHVEQVRLLVSCGRAARSAAKIRVRQPLAAMDLHHRHAEVIKQYEDIIKDELNVKRIDYVSSVEVDDIVQYELKPDFRKIGPKHGSLAPKIKAALAAHRDVQSLVRSLEQDGEFQLDIDGQRVWLTAGEVAIELHAKEGWTAERIPGSGILVLDTHLTPELKDEGTARDLVNQVQQIRKQLDLRYEQRIDLAVTGPDDLQRVLNAFGKYVMGETLAQTLLNRPIPGVEPAAAKIAGHDVAIYVKPL